jgi:hypothetical protein
MASASRPTKIKIGRARYCFDWALAKKWPFLWPNYQVACNRCTWTFIEISLTKSEDSSCLVCIVGPLFLQAARRLEASDKTMDGGV